MRWFTLWIIGIVVLVSLLQMCRQDMQSDDTGDYEFTIQPRPDDPTIPVELQLIDSLVQARKYRDARALLTYFLDTIDNNSAYLRNRALNLFCYSIVRDRDFTNKDTTYHLLQQLTLTGDRQDTLILGEQALILGYSHISNDPDSAKWYFDRSLQLLQSFYPEDDPGMQKYYRDIGSYLLFDVEDTRKALELFTKEALLHRRWLYSSRDRFLNAYNLGVVHRILEEYDLAEHFQKQAINEIRGTGIDTTEIIILPYASLSYLHAHRQNVPGLNAYVDTTLDLVNRFFAGDTAELIDYHTTLAMCYIPGNTDDPERGLAILAKLPHYTEQMSEYTAHYADLSRARAYLYYGSGAMDQARTEMRRAIDLFRHAESLGSYHFYGYVDALLGLGVFNIEAGIHIQEGASMVNEAAELYFGKSLEEVAERYPARFLKYYSRWYDYLIAYGDYLLVSAKPERRLPGIAHLSARIDSTIAISRDKVSDHDVLRNARLNHDIYTYMIGWCHDLQRVTQDEEVLHMAFNYFEKSRAHLLLTQLSTLKLAEQLGVPGKIIEQGVAITREEVATSAYLDEKGVDALLARKQEYFQLLKSQYPEYYFKTYQPDRASLSDILSTLRADEAIIHYQLRDTQLYALVITSDTLMLRRSGFNDLCAGAVDALYSRVRDRPALGRDVRDILGFWDNTKEVFRCVLGNIYPAIERKRKWWISADNILEMVPFEILTDPSQDPGQSFGTLPYMVNKHDIGYLLSATTWHAGQLRPDPELGQVAAFIHSDGSHSVRAHDLERDTTRYMGMPGTLKAARAIRKTFGSGNVSIFRNKKATIAAFLNSLDKYDILHLGLHAFGDTTGHQRHGIVFPGDPSSLTVPDIIGQRTKASIIFLEGCETALGKQIRGEGMLNFARPFIAAGARHVLASRWKLDDQSAGQMAGHFYRELKASRDVAYSNSEAKRLFLKQASRLQSHPYYWAAVMSVQ